MSDLLRRALAAGVASGLILASVPQGAAAQAPASTVSTPPLDQRAKVWPQSYSDVPPDPQVRFGVLSNGLRYALMHNDNPKGQTSLRLLIGSGSIEESDAEQGLAHVLEHMAFKGSTHAPQDQMVKILERLGLNFGGDTNARTGWTDTVYQLDLPESDAKTLDVGLTLLSDVGSGLLLKPEALQSERGVVLSEERLRDTPDYEVQKARLQFELKGQLAADRMPIGKVKVIQTAPASLVRSFYDANYRPDRAVLVAVGDFDPAQMQARIAALFGGWTGRGPETPQPALGTPARRGEAIQLVVRQGAAPSLAIAWVKPRDEEADSLAKERREFIENLALAALNRRYQRVAHAAEPPFLNAAAAQGDFVHSAQVTQLNVQFRAAGWRRALEAAVQMQRQAVQYGFSQAEVDREITETGVTLRNAAAGASTRRTPAVAEELIRSVEDQEVETSPEQDLTLFERYTHGLSADEVNAAFRRLFAGSGPLVSLASPVAIDGGEGGVAAAFRAAETAPLAPPAALQALRWSHTDFGPPGKIVETRTVADLGATFVRFANGVRLTVKPTAFRKDQVLVSVNFGHGRLELPRDHVGPQWAASALIGGGLTDLPYEDIQQVLADRSTSASFGVGDEAFTLSGGTRPQDLQVEMQLLAAHMTAPGWRPEAFSRAQNLFAVALAQLPATPQGVQSRDLSLLQHDGDARWALPTLDDVRNARLEQLKALLQPALSHGPIEVVIAGDVSVAAAEAAVASTFGALPRRGDDPVPPGADQVRYPAGGGAPVTRDHHGRPDQAVAYVGWGATDLLSDAERARRINIAAEVLQLRLTDQVRIAEGASYSPAAGANESETFPGYGYVYAAVETPPAKIAGFYATAAKIAADLRTRDVTPDELQRAVRPRIETIEKAQQTNGYWVLMLHGAATDPRRLDLIRTSVSGYRQLTPADIRTTAAAYLTDRGAWRFQVEPAMVSTHAAAASSGSSR